MIKIIIEHIPNGCGYENCCSWHDAVIEVYVDGNLETTINKGWCTVWDSDELKEILKGTPYENFDSVEGYFD